MKKIIIIAFSLFCSFQFFASPFNKNISEDDISKLSEGELLIKNINFPRNMCLKENYSELGNLLIKDTKKYAPKYLAEVISVRPIEGNEDLDQKLAELLYNVSDYAGIPYYSEQISLWFNLYDSAEIIKTETINENHDRIDADLIMTPFDKVQEQIDIFKSDNSMLYIATNKNKLRWYDKFDCIWPEKMKICILLLKDEENWILYGLGGANVPRLPFLSDRIQTSLINRINTFCTYIYSKL